MQGGGPNGWMSRVRPQSSSRKKKGSRCRAHASFRKHVDPSEWRTVWEKAPDEFKIGIASMLPSELLQVTCQKKIICFLDLTNYICLFFILYVTDTI